MTDDQDQSPCVVADCMRPQGPAIRICSTHAAQLGDWLARLDTEYALLDAVPSMQGREPGTGGRSGLASHRSPAALDVLVLRDRRTTMAATPDPHPRAQVAVAKSIGPWCVLCDHDSCKAWRAGRQREDFDDEAAVGSHRTLSVFGVLHGWAEYVREERNLAYPATHIDPCTTPCMHYACQFGVAHEVRTPLTVLSERRVLANQLDWLLAQDCAGVFYAEIRQLWSLLKSSNSPEPRTTRRLCGCGGHIRWHDDAAECGSCGTRTTGLDVIRQQAEAAVA